MGGLFNLKTAMVSVLHKELDCKVEKLKSGADWWAPAQIQEVLGHAAEDQNQIRSSIGKQTILDQSTRSFTVVVDWYSLSFISEE